MNNEKYNINTRNYYLNNIPIEEALESYEVALEIRVKEKKLQDEAKVLNGLAQCYNLLNNKD